MHKNLKTQFCGLNLDSPIVLLSGCVGFGEEYTRIKGFSNKDVGAICLKGTTLEPRLGNIPSRVTETPEGMINAIGLQNPGTDVVINEIMPTLDKAETRFIINISGSSVEEYGEISKRFDDSDIDAIEINISCPNVKEGGVAFGNDPDMSYRVVDICRKNTSKPLITKLSPNQTDIGLSAQRCIDAGTDGLAVINTLMGMSINTHTRRPVIGNNQGGLSGPAIKPIALLKVTLRTGAIQTTATLKISYGATQNLMSRLKGSRVTCLFTLIKLSRLSTESIVILDFLQKKRVSGLE